MNYRGWVSTLKKKKVEKKALQGRQTGGNGGKNRDQKGKRKTFPMG